MVLGIDHAGRPSDYPAFAQAVYGTGYRFEFRYLCDPNARSINAVKIARLAEVQASRDAGLEVVLIWQNTKSDALGGYEVGRRDGTWAAYQAANLEYPEGFTIYFAIGDYDAPSSDFPTIREYLRGVNETVGPYRVGGYGKRSVVEDARNLGLIQKVFQSYGFSRPVGEVSPKADVYQRRQQTTIQGVTCDVDESFGEIGGWGMDLWHPRATRVVPAKYPNGAGDYAPGYSWRQVLHTTEGGPNYSPSSLSFFGNQYWPHATIGRVDGKARITQHLPLTKAARAAQNQSGGVETNLARAVQAEICWWAGKISELPDDIAECVEDWVRWVALQTGSSLSGPTFYGPDAGWSLATPTSRQRMSFAAWNTFNGICGHQHVPENSHWDPGALDLAKVLDLEPSPREDDEVFEYRIVTVPPPQNGKQLVSKDVEGKTLGVFRYDVVATLKANDNGDPVKGTVQVVKAFNSDDLVLSFVGLDGGLVPEGNVGVVLSHPRR